jgi:hypothetical protein
MSLEGLKDTNNLPKEAMNNHIVEPIVRSELSLCSKGNNINLLAQLQAKRK